jgi:L-amino acid N-acyltransferase YncA
MPVTGALRVRSATAGDLPAIVAIYNAVAAGLEELGIRRRHGRLDGRWKEWVLVEWLLGDAAGS